MVSRLVEADYFAGRAEPTNENVKFWLLELRTPQLLMEVAAEHTAIAHSLVSIRPLLEFALANNEGLLSDALLIEEKAVREVDKKYWQPLKTELEHLRLNRPRF